MCEQYRDAQVKVCQVLSTVRVGGRGFAEAAGMDAA